MKLSDFILEFPCDEEVESDEDLANLEVVIEIQAEKDTVQVGNGQKVTIKEVVRDWHSNIITIKTDYL